jgi:hypothetical protein
MDLKIPVDSRTSIVHTLTLDEVCQLTDFNKLDTQITAQQYELLQDADFLIKADDFARRAIIDRITKKQETVIHTFVVGHVADQPIVLRLFFIKTEEGMVCFYDMQGDVVVWSFANCFFNRFLPKGVQRVMDQALKDLFKKS